LRITFLVTAGPTREYIDPVRFLSNPSSGKMGYALAGAAVKAGARAILISGPTALRPPKEVKFVPVESAGEMRVAVMANKRAADVIIMAAAVADYRPDKKLTKKMKKSANRISLPMVRTPDILAELGRKKAGKILVGFAAETGSMLREGRRKLEEKNLDMIIANDVSRSGCGFGGDYNKAIIMDREGNVDRMPRMRKDRLAAIIVRRALLLRQQKSRVSSCE